MDKSSTEKNDILNIRLTLKGSEGSNLLDFYKDFLTWLQAREEEEKIQLHFVASDYNNRKDFP